MNEKFLEVLLILELMTSWKQNNKDELNTAHVIEESWALVMGFPMSPKTAQSGSPASLTGMR